MSLTNKTIANSYKDVLQVNNGNSGVDATTRQVKDGGGAGSSLFLSDDTLQVRPVNDNTTTSFDVRNTSNTSLFSVDTTNTAVKALSQYANTNVKEFGLSSKAAKPATANTWSPLSAMGTDSFNSTGWEMGTGATPLTSLDVSANAVNFNTAMSIWYVPFNIAIDSVHALVCADTTTGDTFKMSVMAYNISTANDATGGDLSGGAEVCVSPSTIAGAGSEQIYYQSLTISTSDVDAGKAIVAFIHQDGVNSDLTVSMQLVYHLRSA